ncbi:MAG: WxcM-like domain-containing protein [Acidobacteriota bacterium]
MLSKPGQALYIGPITRKTFDRFSPDCLLLVLASQLYDEEDHIDDFQEFLFLTGVN